MRIKLLACDINDVICDLTYFKWYICTFLEGLFKTLGRNCYLAEIYEAGVGLPNVGSQHYLIVYQMQAQSANFPFLYN
jgi:hypothetical protein